jgi:hypothetical protein
VAAKQERGGQEEIEVIRDNRTELVKSATVSESASISESATVSESASVSESATESES